MTTTIPATTPATTMTPAEIRTFVTAGNAVFTIVSRKTGDRLTLRVRAGRNPGTLLVSVLTGPDNTCDYTYIGYLRGGDYVHSPKSRIGRGAPSVLAFRWVWEHVRIGRPIPAADFFHEGRCGKCARALTVPESVASGIGPECARRLAGPPGGKAPRSAVRLSRAARTASTQCPLHPDVRTASPDGAVPDAIQCHRCEQESRCSAPGSRPGRSVPLDILEKQARIDRARAEGLDV